MQHGMLDGPRPLPRVRRDRLCGPRDRPAGERIWTYGHTLEAHLAAWGSVPAAPPENPRCHMDPGEPACVCVCIVSDGRWFYL